MLSLGSTVILLAFSSEHTFRFDSGIGNGDLAEPSGNVTVDATKAKKARKKLRKRMLAACNKPHITLLASMLCEEALQEDWVSFCPDQFDHLKKTGDKWLWEDCTLCVHDRRRILEKIRQLNSPEELTNVEFFTQTASEQKLDDAVEAIAHEITSKPQIDQTRGVSCKAIPERNLTQAASKESESDKNVHIPCNPVEEPDLEFPYVEDPERFAVEEEQRATEDGQFDDPWSEIGQGSLPSEDWCEDVRAADMDDATEGVSYFDGPTEESYLNQTQPFHYQQPS
jgi:hypothetical protein